MLLQLATNKCPLLLKSPRQAWPHGGQAGCCYDRTGKADDIIWLFPPNSWEAQEPGAGTCPIIPSYPGLHFSLTIHARPLYQEGTAACSSVSGAPNYPLCMYTHILSLLFATHTLAGYSFIKLKHCPLSLYLPKLALCLFSSSGYLTQRLERKTHTDREGPVNRLAAQDL